MPGQQHQTPATLDSAAPQQAQPAPGLAKQGALGNQAMLDRMPGGAIIETPVFPDSAVEEAGHSHTHDHDHGQDHGSAEEKADLNALVKNNTVEEGGRVTHQKPEDADRHIKTILAQYVQSGGKGITGKVAVVGDANWDKAGENHYSKTKWHSIRKGAGVKYRNSINGFVDRRGRVWIHKDRGNAGTMIHEAVHKWSDNALLHKSQPLNEGVTEYFTRKVCEGAKINIRSRRNYQRNWKATKALVDMVGEDAVGKAYFSGDMKGLREAFEAINKGQFANFIAHTKKNDWSKAKALCTTTSK